MAYFFNKTLAADIDTVEAHVTAALKAKGFGILTHINVQAVLKEKIGEDIEPYRILGACNPNFAFKALQADNKIGTMMPCSVIVRATPDGGTEVAAIDPVASMQAVNNDDVSCIAAEVADLLQSVVTNLTL